MADDEGSGTAGSGSGVDEPAEAEKQLVEVGEALDMLGSGELGEDAWSVWCSCMEAECRTADEQRSVLRAASTSRLVWLRSKLRSRGIAV